METVDVAITESSRSGLRAWLMAAYVTALVFFFGRAGISFDKEIVLLVVIGALAVWCVGRPWSEARQLALGWVPFLAALVVYDAARSAAQTLGRPVAVTPQIAAEKLLFFGHVPTVSLQSHFLDKTVHWYDVAASLVYVSHFFVIFVVAGWLWSRDRYGWGVFATRFFVLCFTAALTFAIVPTAPPWAASQMHEIGPVVRSAAHGWSALHLKEPEVLLQQGRHSANPYAAVPSLHFAWSMLVSITLWPYVRRRATKTLLVVYPVAMTLTLVYTGEHYVFDALVGACYVLAAVSIVKFFCGLRRPNPVPEAAKTSARL